MEKIIKFIKRIFGLGEKTQLLDEQEEKETEQKPKNDSQTNKEFIDKLKDKTEDTEIEKVKKQVETQTSNGCGLGIKDNISS